MTGPPRASPPPGSTSRPLPGLAAYAAATAITVFSIASQYFLPQLLPALVPVYASLVGDLLIVYGIPITTFLLLIGPAPLAGALKNNGVAAVESLRWYGLLTVVALILEVVALTVLLAVDPAAVNRLSAPTPIVKVAEQAPWFWAALSFPIGVCEEVIFRGWIFGYWMRRDPAGWKVPLVWTSFLFAGVHVYYALTYGPAFIVPAIVLVLDGFAFALAFQASGGNLVAVSLLHGWNDATVFIALAMPGLGLGLHYAAVLAGVAIAVGLYLRQRPVGDPISPIAPFGPPPPPGGL